jgi:hypothetical protein
LARITQEQDKGYTQDEGGPVRHMAPVRKKIKI